MIEQDYLRRFATWLLGVALRLSPEPARPWGEAMLAEIAFVKSSWAALGWAAGGAGVLMKQAAVCLFIRPGMQPTGPLADSSSGGVPMRKTVIATVAVCLAAFFLILLAPEFRQAFDVSINSWRLAFSQTSYSVLPTAEFNSLVERAQ
jgi:hypothetical protein